MTHDPKRRERLSREGKGGGASGVAGAASFYAAMLDILYFLPVSFYDAATSGSSSLDLLRRFGPR